MKVTGKRMAEPDDETPWKRRKYDDIDDIDDEIDDIEIDDYIPRTFKGKRAHDFDDDTDDMMTFKRPKYNDYDPTKVLNFDLMSLNPSSLNADTFAIVAGNRMSDVDVQISYKTNLRQSYRVNGLYQANDPEIKWRYLVRTVALSNDLKLKLKVFLCLNPDYKLTMENATYDKIVEMTSRIDILRRGTTMWNREHINVIHPIEVDRELRDRLEVSGGEFYITPAQSKLLYFSRKVLYSFALELKDGFCTNDPIGKHISYRGMTSVMKIGNKWMSQCNLQSVNFTGLSQLMAVGNGWLSHCHSLKDVNFSGLNRLRSVGNEWMFGCSQLKSPDFEGLSALTTVGNAWMLRCESLQAPDFTALSELRIVGNNWMEGCPLLSESTKQFKIEFQRRDGGGKKRKSNKKKKRRSRK